jgi:glutathione S-transferase
VILPDNLSSGNGYKARLLLAHLGLPFERVEYDIDRAETRTPEFLRINPNGRVPVLELEDGRFLPESNAILFYLSEGTPFLPGDRFERAQVLHARTPEDGFDLGRFPAVRAWLQRVAAQPGHIPITQG